MTDRLALQFAHRSLCLGHSASLRISIRSKFQVQIALPFSFCSAHSPLCSGSSLVLRSKLREISPINASLNSGMSNSMVNEAEPKELRDESDFEAIFSGGDFTSVCGFGSLLSGMYDWDNNLIVSYSRWLILCCDRFVCLISLSVEAERSARSTFPELINFRVARLNGFRRVFGNVAPIFFERGIAKPETKVFLFLRFCAYCFICSISDWIQRNFVKREVRYMYNWWLSFSSSIFLSVFKSSFSSNLMNLAIMFNDMLYVWISGDLKLVCGALRRRDYHCDGFRD